MANSQQWGRQNNHTGLDSPPVFACTIVYASLDLHACDNYAGTSQDAPPPPSKHNPQGPHPALSKKHKSIAKATQLAKVCV